MDNGFYYLTNNAIVCFECENMLSNFLNAYNKDSMQYAIINTLIEDIVIFDNTFFREVIINGRNEEDIKTRYKQNVNTALSLLRGLNKSISACINNFLDIYGYIDADLTNTIHKAKHEINSVYLKYLDEFGGM